MKNSTNTVKGGFTFAAWVCLAARNHRASRILIRQARHISVSREAVCLPCAALQGGKFTLAIQPDGALYAKLPHRANAPSVAVSQVPLPVQQWVHVLFTYKAGQYVACACASVLTSLTALYLCSILIASPLPCVLAPPKTTWAP
ncbi:MAG: LamG domain-containing protein [Opitutales bacterium]|nr:LamG domain-containing protein [Opitutales bacterium]